MPDRPARLPRPPQLAARVGDRGMIPVTIVKDWGDALQVEYSMEGVGGPMTYRFWVARVDFEPAPPLAP